MANKKVVVFQTTFRCLQNIVIDCIDKNVTDWGKIKMVVKETLSDYLWKKIKRNPMILPIIMEVE